MTTAEQLARLIMDADIPKRLLAENDRLRSELDGERESRIRLDNALRQKDEAMGVLFERLNKAGVDCSDLIS